MSIIKITNALFLCSSCEGRGEEGETEREEGGRKEGRRGGSTEGREGVWKRREWEEASRKSAGESLANETSLDDN